MSVGADGGSGAWAGMGWLLMSPLAWAALLAGVSATATSARIPVLAACVALGGAAVVALPESVTDAAGVLVLLVGGVGAGRLRLPPRGAALLAVLSGAAAGAAAGFHWATRPEWLGALAALSASMALLCGVLRTLLRRPGLARPLGLGLAIVGAWAAALGGLMGLLGPRL